MFVVIYHTFRCNGWNEWTEEKQLGVVESKEQGFEYAKKHYPKLKALMFKKYDAYDQQGKKTNIPYSDYIEIKEIKALGGK